MKHELHPDQAALSKALYVIRLRHGPFRSGDRWIRRTVAERRRSNERAWDSRMKVQPWHPKRWQPDHGRESPREEWMSWRRSMIAYSFPGWMRFHHGKAPPLVGRTLLYDPYAPRSRFGV